MRRATGVSHATGPARDIKAIVKNLSQTNGFSGGGGGGSGTISSDMSIAAGADPLLADLDYLNASTGNTNSTNVPPTVAYYSLDGNQSLDTKSIKDPHHHVFWMACIEFLITFLYAFITVLATSLSLPFLYQGLARTAIVIFTTAIGVAHSGAHLNSYVTLLFVLLRRFHVYHGIIYILLVHPLAYAAGSAAAIGVSPAPLIAAVPFHLENYWRVAIYEFISTSVVAVAVVWATLSPLLLRRYPQVLPNHNSVALIALPTPVLIGFAYLSTTVPGMFISGSVQAFWPYLFPAAYAGIIDSRAIVVYLFAPMAATLFIWLGSVLCAMVFESDHKGSKPASQTPRAPRSDDIGGTYDVGDEKLR